jgi:hypothetical protein
MSSSKELKIKVRGKQPSEKLMALIHEVVDAGLKFTSMVNKLWEQGAEEGFSREEIADIVRPIARKKGLNKDQVYYLTHKPELQQKSKKQYADLKEKTRNIPISTAAEAEAEVTTEPEQQPQPEPEVKPELSMEQKKDALWEDLKDYAGVKKAATTEIIQPQPEPEPEPKPEPVAQAKAGFKVVSVEECSRWDIEKYDAPLLRQWILKMLKEQDDLDLNFRVQQLGHFTSMIHEMLVADKGLLKIVVDKIAKEVKIQESKSGKRNLDNMNGLQHIAHQIIMNKQMGPIVNKAVGGSGAKKSNEHYITWIGLDSPYEVAVYALEAIKSKSKSKTKTKATSGGSTK